MNVSTDPVWQRLFEQIYLNDARTDSAEDPVVNLVTPEKEKPAKRVGQAEPARAMQPAQREAPVLMKPCKLRKEQKRKEPETVQGDDAVKPDPDALHMESESAEEEERNSKSKRFVKRKHSRRKKVEKTENDRKDQLVKEFLVNKGLDYGCFQLVHRRSAKLAKSGICTDRGYVAFKTNLRCEHEIKCLACKDSWQMERISIL